MAVEILTPSIADGLRAQPLSYEEVGATAGPLPTGYTHLTRTRVLGVAFDDAARHVMTWQVQARSGLHVRASAPDVEPDGVVLLGLGWGRLGLSIPCRVVRVVDEPDRRGFAYGTLPGHPERGEESFVVSRDGAGAVTFTITAFSRPATRLARLGGPVSSRVQLFVTGRYLRSLD